jgi:hypothetical protein
MAKRSMVTSHRHRRVDVMKFPSKKAMILPMHDMEVQKPI